MSTVTPTNMINSPSSLHAATRVENNDCNPAKWRTSLKTRRIRVTRTKRSTYGRDIIENDLIANEKLQNNTKQYFKLLVNINSYTIPIVYEKCFEKFFFQPLYI